MVRLPVLARQCAAVSMAVELMTLPEQVAYAFPSLSFSRSRATGEVCALQDVPLTMRPPPAMTPDTAPQASTFVKKVEGAGVSGVSPQAAAIIATSAHAPRMAT